MNRTRLCKKLLCAVLGFTIFIAGCGGHAPNPIDKYMVGDERKSCDTLYAEMSQLNAEIKEKKKDKNSRDTWNTINFVAGFFLIVPWFFIDTKKSHEVEIEAFQARKKALLIIAQDKGCDTPSTQ